MDIISKSGRVKGLARPQLAVVGAGVAGAACAAELQRAGLDVTLFDKSADVGGRMAMRRAHWTAADGSPRCATFDHGCPAFAVSRPRFRAAVDRAVNEGHAARGLQYLYATYPTSRMQEVIVPTPDMPAFCRYLLGGVSQRLGEGVTGLQRRADGWYLQLASGATAGSFDQVALALPAVEASSLLAFHRQDWADALATVSMHPCWTLMAVSDEVDWPWDVAEVEHGELGWIIRNDRLPGRHAIPDRLVPWVAHATPAWSQAHLEADPASVCEVLGVALARLLPGGLPGGYRFIGAHRWRHARLAQAAAVDQDCWWDPGLGLGVCGDAFGDGSVEAAWCSGDELADAVAATLDTGEAFERAQVPIENVRPAAASAARPTTVRSPAPRFDRGTVDQSH